MSEVRVGEGEVPDYDAMSAEDLEKLFDGADPVAADSTVEEVAEPESQQEVPAEEATEQPAEESESTEAQPAPEAVSDVVADDESDPVKMLEKQIELERKANEAEKELQRAHSSRLAGEIGFLKQQLKSRSQEPPPDIPEGDDRLIELQAKIQKLEATQRQDAINVALAAETERFHKMFAEASYEAEDVKGVAERYVDYWQQALDSTDANSAGSMARAVLNKIAVDLEGMKLDRLRKSAQEKRSAQLASMAESKKKAVISGSGSAPAPKPKPKSYEDMSAEELDKELRRLYGDRSP